MIPLFIWYILDPCWTLWTPHRGNPSATTAHQPVQRNNAYGWCITNTTLNCYNESFHQVWVGCRSYSPYFLNYLRNKKLMGNRSGEVGTHLWLFCICDPMFPCYCLVVCSWLACQLINTYSESPCIRGLQGNVIVLVIQSAQDNKLYWVVLLESLITFYLYFDELKWLLCQNMSVTTFYSPRYWQICQTQHLVISEINRFWVYQNEKEKNYNFLFNSSSCEKFAKFQFFNQM